MQENTSLFSGKRKDKRYLVKSLTKGMRLFERFLVSNSAEKKQTRKGDWYILLEVADFTGRMRLNFWGVPIEKIDYYLKEVFIENKVLALTVKVEEYRDRLNLNMNFQEGNEPWICQYSEDSEKTDYFIEDFNLVPADWHQVPVEEMFSYIQNKIDKIRNRFFRALLFSFWEDQDLRYKFVTLPAGKVIHHCYVHGLLEHTYEMLILAESVILNYPHIDKDLLITGIVFHDLGKVAAYQLGQFQIEITETEKHVGHMSWVVSLLLAKTIEFDITGSSNDWLRLQNIILSHHGSVDKGFGSSVNPQTPEAEVIYWLDELSAKNNTEYVKYKRDNLV